MANSVLTELITLLRIPWIRFRKLFHRHSYDIPGAEEIKVGLVGGYHTAFMVLKCKCGNKIVFPDDNFKLAMNEGSYPPKLIIPVSRPTLYAMQEV